MTPETDEAVLLVRSVANNTQRPGYSIGAILARMETFQKPNGITYAEFALKHLSEDEIVNIWRQVPAGFGRRR